MTAPIFSSVRPPFTASLHPRRRALTVRLRPLRGWFLLLPPRNAFCASFGCAPSAVCSVSSRAAESALFCALFGTMTLFDTKQDDKARVPSLPRAQIASAITGLQRTHFSKASETPPCRSCSPPGDPYSNIEHSRSASSTYRTVESAFTHSGCRDRRPLSELLVRRQAQAGNANPST